MNPRQWMAFAGGASAALIASRVLPPILSQGLASWDRGRGQDPFDVLARDHERFRHLLEEMAGSQGRGAAYRGQLFLRLKRGLAAHAMAEEDVVYPLLREDVGAEAAVNRFYEEHGMIKTHLYALERTLRDEERWIARAGQLKSLVERHAREEDEVEFPRLRGMLDDEAVMRVARHIHREKALVL